MSAITFGQAIDKANAESQRYGSRTRFSPRFIIGNGQKKRIVVMITKPDVVEQAYMHSMFKWMEKHPITKIYKDSEGNVKKSSWIHVHLKCEGNEDENFCPLCAKNEEWALELRDGRRTKEQMFISRPIVKFAIPVLEYEVDEKNQPIMENGVPKYTFKVWGELNKDVLEKIASIGYNPEYQEWPNVDEPTLAQLKEAVPHFEQLGNLLFVDFEVSKSQGKGPDLTPQRKCFVSDILPKVLEEFEKAEIDVTQGFTSYSHEVYEQIAAGDEVVLDYTQPFSDDDGDNKSDNDEPKTESKTAPVDPQVIDSVEFDSLLKSI